MARVMIVTCAVVALGISQTALAQQMASTSQAVVQDAPAAAVAPLPSTTGDNGASAAMATPNGQPPTGGTVAELQQLVHGGGLTELRTSYNGTFGASLLFYPQEMTYYVALFEQKNFWRVIKTSDSVRAEAIFADFVKQSVKLSSVEIRRIQLDAQKDFTNRAIAASQEHAQQLEADLAIRQSQQQVVDAHQQVNQQQASALEAEKQAAQAQLDAIRQRIADLQRQADAGLPKAGQSTQ